MARKEKKYNILIGKNDNQYVFLDYIFDDGDGFCGATGTILSPISKQEYDERMSIHSVKERYDDIWRDAVKNGNTDESLEEWCQSILDGDGEEGVFDLSGTKYWDQVRKLGLTEEEYPVFECIGGGRCFTSNSTFEKVYDKKLLKAVQEIEAKAEGRNIKAIKKVVKKINTKNNILKISVKKKRNKHGSI